MNPKLVAGGNGDVTKICRFAFLVFVIWQSPSDTFYLLFFLQFIHTNCEGALRNIELYQFRNI